METTFLVQFAKGLCLATRLRVLDLGDLRATAAGVTAFASALHSLSHLESLNFKGMMRA